MSFDEGRVSKELRRFLDGDGMRRTGPTFLMGRWGALLSAAIIAARAFQPNAEPMTSWSFWSWVLMTLPFTYPLLVLAMLVVLVLACALIVEVAK